MIAHTTYFQTEKCRRKMILVHGGHNIRFQITYQIFQIGILYYVLAESYFDVLKRHQQMLMITPETIPDQYMIRFTCLEHNQVIDQHHFFSLAMQPIA